MPFTLAETTVRIHFPRLSWTSMGSWLRALLLGFLHTPQSWASSICGLQRDRDRLQTCNEFLNVSRGLKHQGPVVEYAFGLWHLWATGSHSAGDWKDPRAARIGLEGPVIWLSKFVNFLWSMIQERALPLSLLSNKTGGKKTCLICLITHVQTRLITFLDLPSFCMEVDFLLRLILHSLGYSCQCWGLASRHVLSWLLLSV